MMNKTKLGIVAFVAFGSLTMNAQDDVKAKKILDELSAKTKAYTTIKAEFEFTNEKKDKTKDIQKGKIETKGAKYKLEIPGHEIYCDAKTVWDFIKDANEVQIKDMEVGGDDVVNPSTIFTIYEKGYKYKFETEDATLQTISLFPTNPDKKKFHTVKLLVDKTKKQISSVKMLMKDGSTQTYQIKSFVSNSDVPDTDFKFDPKSHAGVEVDDLRDGK
jgi:outer membrane lipoprotein carrier protein